MLPTKLISPDEMEQLRQVLVAQLGQPQAEQPEVEQEAVEEPNREPASGELSVRVPEVKKPTLTSPIPQPTPAPQAPEAQPSAAPKASSSPAPAAQDPLSKQIDWSDMERQAREWGDDLELDPNKEEKGSKYSLQRQGSTTAALTFDPEEYQGMAEVAENIPAAKQEKAAIKALENQARELGNKEPEADLTGLMALADAWGDGNSNFLRAYKRPESASELKEKLLKYMMEIEKKKSTYSDRIVDFIKAQKAGIDTQKLAEALELRSGIGHTTAGAMAAPKAINGLQKQFNNDDLTKKTLSKLDAAQKARVMIQNVGPGKKLTGEAVKFVMPKLLGEVGNLAISEQERMGGSQAIEDRIKRFFSKAVDGTLTPADKASFLDLVNVLEGSMSTTYERNRRRYAQQGAAAYKDMGLTEEDLFKALGDSPFARPKAPQSSGNGFVAPKKAPKAGGGGGEKVLSGPALGTIKKAKDGKKYKRVKGGENRKDAWVEVK